MQTFMVAKVCRHSWWPKCADIHGCLDFPNISVKNLDLVSGSCLFVVDTVVTCLAATVKSSQDLPPLN